MRNLFQILFYLYVSIYLTTCIVLKVVTLSTTFVLILVILGMLAIREISTENNDKIIKETADSD